MSTQIRVADPPWQCGDEDPLAFVPPERLPRPCHLCHGTGRVRVGFEVEPQSRKDRTIIATKTAEGYCYEDIFDKPLLDYRNYRCWRCDGEGKIRATDA